MKAKHMRKIIDKNIFPLTVKYGVEPEVAIPLATHIDSCVSIDIGWIKLHFGWDDRWSPVVYAITGRRTFLLSATVDTKHTEVKRDIGDPWVHAITLNTPDFSVGGPEPIIMNYVGYHVEFGYDSHDRDYVWVTMPNPELELLFRNPKVPAAASDSHPSVATLRDGVVVGPMDCADTLLQRQELYEVGRDSQGDAFVPMSDCAEILPPLIRKTAESTGDAELDALLASLG